MPNAEPQFAQRPQVDAFFDEETSTLTYVVSAPKTAQCLIIDPVLGLDVTTATLSTRGADKVAAFVRQNQLEVVYILDTHIHADHLSAATYLRNVLGGSLGIGSSIDTTHDLLADWLAESPSSRVASSHFDILLSDCDTLEFGEMQILALHVPGHTPGCMAYLIGDALFAGDTLFMPDSGTARCDFPGGSAASLYQSVQRLMDLPDETRVFVCHDYQPNGRELAFESSVGEQRMQNIHVNTAVSETEFIEMRVTRDASLTVPALMLPSLQVNLQAGALPTHSVNKRPVITLPLTCDDDEASLALLL